MTDNNPPSVGAKDLQDLQGVSRAPGIALLQKQMVPDAPRPKDPAPAASAPTALMAQPAAAVENAKRAIYQALRQFSPGDYLKWFWEYVRFRFGPRHPFLTYAEKTPADGVYPLTGDGGGDGDGEDGEIRIGIAGDWGTGTDEAHRIAALMGDAKPHYTIHLGDVYFVGDTAEVRENFLGQQRTGSRYVPCRWPAGSKASFALNGNHEMYARGIAYFEEILPALGPVIGGAVQGQKASFFCLKNEAWCLLGLDTGYNSVGWPILEYVWSPNAELPDEIVTWLKAIAPQIETQAVILLTHHQVLSAYDDCFTKQADQIFAILKRPVLWFWGHEHRLALYEPYAERANWPVITGRCVGHGGMPVDLPGTPKPGSIGKASFVDRRRYHNDERLHIGINGYAQLTFKGPQLAVDYVDVFGKTVYTENFRSEGGAVTAQSSENIALSPA